MDEFFKFNKRYQKLLKISDLLGRNLKEEIKELIDLYLVELEEKLLKL